MPSVLILCAHRPHRSPSQRYRFEQYLAFLETQGFTFRYSYLLNEREDRIFYSAGNFAAKVLILIRSVLTRVKDWLCYRNYDIIFIQREASFLGTYFFEKRAAGSGAYVIFDFDDSIWLADTSPGNKKWEFIKKPEKFFTNVRCANMVIAGNAYLAEKARTVNRRVTIIPTTIDTDVHIPKPWLRNGETVTIGWSGSISTIKHFELLLPVLIRLKARYGDMLRFKVIGDKHYSNAQLDVEAVAWSEATEVDQLNSLDIGIMPLPDDAWANGKCGLKALSYMACGVPAVLSAVGVNKDIIQQNINGLLAGSEQEWLDHLCRLIENKVLRESLGAAGRKTVLDHYSVAANKHHYLEVFRHAGRY